MTQAEFHAAYPPDMLRRIPGPLSAKRGHETRTSAFAPKLTGLVQFGGTPLKPFSPAIAHRSRKAPRSIADTRAPVISC
jgi:hypothetical protein